MVNTFNCPTCGGPLAYTPRIETTVRCPYCHNTVIIPEGLRDSLRSGGLTSADERYKSNNQTLPAFDRMQVEIQIRNQLAAGQKINAIKIYRQATGAGLKQAKEAVEAFEAGAPLDAISLTPAGRVSTTTEDGGSIISQATRLVHAGKKIDAIRLLRNHYDINLKVAKDAAEMLEKGQNVDIEWLKKKAVQVQRTLQVQYTWQCIAPTNQNDDSSKNWIQL